MKRYIAMLRGINVSGHKKILMADLREHLAELDLENVTTYIQSGNIVFDAKSNSLTTLENQIQSKIREKYGFDVPTTVRRPGDFANVIKSHPYKDKDLKKIYVTFLSKKPKTELLKAVDQKAYFPEEFILDGKVIYGHSPIGFAQAKISNNFFEKKLKVQATTRNWRTVNVLYDLATNNEQR